MCIKERVARDFGIILNSRSPVQKVAHLIILEMLSNIVHLNQNQKSQFYSSLTVISQRKTSKLVLQNSMVSREHPSIRSLI